MTVSFSILGGAGAQFFSDAGVPLSGGKLYTYAAGTTTPLTTYTTSTGLVARPNPIVLDAAGRVPDSGEIWLTDGVGYKFVLKTSTGTLIKTWDNITGVSSNITASNVNYTPGTGSLLPSPITVAGALNGLSNNTIGSAYMGFLQSGGSAVARTVQAKLRDTVSVKDFGAVGNGIADDTAAFQVAVNALANNGGGTLYVPAGTYKLTDTITINRSICVAGESIQSTYLHLYVSTAKPAIYFDGTANIIFGGGVSNMWITCDKGTVAGDGIKLKATTPSAITTAAIRDVVVYSARDGIVLEGTSASEVYMNTVENVKVVGAPLVAGVNSLRYGFYANAASYNSFRNCEATNIGNAGFAFYVSGLGTYFNNITTDGVSFLNCAYGSIDQWTVETIQCTSPAIGEVLSIAAALSVNNVTILDVANSKCEVGVKLFSYTMINSLRIDTTGSSYPNYPIALDVNASGVIMNCSGRKTFKIEQYTAAAVIEAFTFVNSTDFTDRQTGVRNVASGGKPTAAEVLRGQLVLEKGAAGVADVIYVCRKNAANTYEWQALA